MVKVPQWFINLWNEGFYDEEEQMEAIGTAFTKKNIEPEDARVVVLTSPFYSLIWLCKRWIAYGGNAMIVTIEYFKLKY